MDESELCHVGPSGATKGQLAETKADMAELP